MLHPHCSSLSIAATSDGVRIVVSSQRSPSLVSPPSHLWSSQWKHPFKTGSKPLGSRRPSASKHAAASPRKVNVQHRFKATLKPVHNRPQHVARLSVIRPGLIV